MLARSTFDDVCRYFCLHRLWHTLLYRVVAQLDRTLKIWATPENFLSVGRVIGAIDKQPAPETKADTTSRTAEDFGSTP
ncbi:hypothetical protein QUB19_28175 [Microcoleus sp. B4-C5]|uniref:hypothetical protein n=1 Tax=unclassified Microcoleus TaxID=2642155 RepID=UPI002FD5E552